MYRTCLRAVCTDNWSQSGGPRSKLLTNTTKALSQDIDFNVFDKVVRVIDYSELGTFTVYLFDGPHSEQDQYDGIVLAQAALDNSYFLIVDDWNWLQVRVGTFRALRDLKSKIDCGIEVRTTLDNSAPELA